MSIDFDLPWWITIFAPFVQIVGFFLQFVGLLFGG